MAKTGTAGKAKKPVPVSMKTEDAVETGGLWQGGEAVIAEVEYCRYAYPGKDGKATTKPAPVLLISYQHADGIEEQPLSMGGGEWDFYDAEGDECDAGGVMAVSRSGLTGIPKGSNLYEFLTAVESANEASPDQAVDMDELANDCNVLAGKGVKAIRKAQPERPGLGSTRKNRSGEPFARTFVLPDEWLDEAPEFDKPNTNGKGKASAKGSPADKGKAPASAKGKPLGKGSKAKDDTEELHEEALTALTEVLGKNKGTLKLDQLSQKVHQHLKGHPQRDDIAELMDNGDWLGEQAGVTVNEKKNVITLDESA